MARKRTVSSENIDFENLGEFSVDPMLKMREAQSHLYRISNPYVGNKRKIVVDIADSLNRHGYQFNSMLDLFSGSGMVSLFFRLLGKKVAANDLLTSSYYNASLFLENQTHLTSAKIELLCKQDNPSKTDFVRTHYSERFTPEEALFLDNFRANAELLDGHSKIAAIVMIEHYVMSHCFLGGRLNHGQILAKLDHRLNHDRNFSSSPQETLEMTFNLTPLPLFDGPIGSASNLDCLDALKRSNEQEMAYIDPPYGGDQSDYATMFAFCEEYIYQKPLADLSHIKNSKKFVLAKEYERHFLEVLDGARNIPQWAISYNDSSWADINTIKKAVLNFKKNVDIINIDYEYKYRKSSSATEYLIMAR